MNKIFGAYVLMMLLILVAATAAQSAPSASAEADLKIVMVSPPGEAPVRDTVLRVAFIAVYAQPAQLTTRLGNELYVGVKCLDTGRVVAAYPGTRSLVVVEPERCAAMLVGAAPMPGQEEIDPPTIPVRPGRYQVFVQRGDLVLTTWIVTVVPPK